MPVAPAARGWGGARPGAGRKPRGARAGVSHAAREVFASRFPVHVTLSVLPHVWNLRSGRSFRALRAALSVGGQRFGLRLVEFSVQGNHLHLALEAPGREGLARGMQGLAVRIATGLNRVMARRGKVLADRYHAHVLRSPREALHALRYVRWNHHIHAARRGRQAFSGADPCSSAVRDHGVTLAVPGTALLRRARALVSAAGPPWPVELHPPWTARGGLP